MLLTIHNLPPNFRYADIKALFNQKCGLTEVILDNLVSEGQGKKVTVGLPSDDDGALVVRKINGLFIDGCQLYIEDRRRKTAEHDQPYRSSASHIERTPEPQPNSMMGGPAMPMAAVPVMWNYNMVAAPYMGQVPMDQNLAYSGYGGAPMAAPYTPPQPVPAPVENERGYPGFQGAGYAPANESIDLDSGPRNRAEREEGSDRFRRQDRKRRHSPERPVAAKKRESKWNEKEIPQLRREASPPRQQWPQENQGPRPPFREPEQFPRNANQHQPREPKPRPKPVPRNQNKYPPRDPKPQPEQFSRNQNEYPPRDPKPRPGPIPRNQNKYEPRNPEPQPEQFPRNQSQYAPREPKSRPEPVPRNQSLPREPNPDYHRADPQWENRWDEPNPHPRVEHEPEWGSENQRNWEPVTDKVWDTPTNQRWHDDPRPNIETSPQWETREWDSRIPEEEMRPDWFDRQPPNNQRNKFPGDQEFYDPGPVVHESRPRQRDSAWDDRRQRNDRPSPRKLSREPPRDRSKSKGRQERDRRADRPNSSQDRPSGVRDKPDYWKQVANDYPETRRPEFNRGGPQNPPKPDKVPKYKQDTQKRPAFKEEKYPPRDDRRLPGPIIKQPLTLTAMINKDFSNRGQATADIAKKILGVKSKFLDPLSSFTLKQMKLCIKSRIDVMLGEELALDMEDIISRYRSKFPVSGDKVLVQQIREKSAREFDTTIAQLAEKRREENPAKQEPKTGPGGSSQTAAENNGAKDPEVKNYAAKAEVKPINTKVVNATPTPNLGPPTIKLKKGQKNQPLTDKQVIQQMKLQNKWEYSQDDAYKLDAVAGQALEDELIQLDKIFNEECSNPEDPHDEAICKRILTDSVNGFNKTVRLTVTKRLLKIPTGLAMRIFCMGKPPKKEAVKQYLKKYRVESLAVKKSVKGGMFVLNLSRFQDYDELCRIGTDVIDGVPVTFKPLHLTGPPPKVTRTKGFEMRQQRIRSQIEDISLDDFVEIKDYTADIQVPVQSNKVHVNTDNKDEDKNDDDKRDDNKDNDNKCDDNKGDDNQGDDNQGDDNQGDDNQGDDNKGDDNNDDWENTGDDWINNPDGEDWGDKANAATEGVNVDDFNEDDLEDF